MNAADLRRFCAEADDIRCYLCQPWSWGEWTYATNGHIMVRVPRMADVPENEKAPDGEAVMGKQVSPKNWIPVPAATMPPDVECEDCNGTGIAQCNLGHDHDCENCGHTGKIKQRIGMRVEGVSFDQGYLSMIQGWEIAPTGSKAAAWIRNGDALGLIMPRNE